MKMKRILALLLAVTMALALAACGDNGEKASENDGGKATDSREQESSGGSDENGDEAQSYDLTTIEGYLAQFGLIEEFLKTPAFTKFTAATNTETKAVTGINVYQSAAMDAAQKETYVKGINDALIAVADDGKISSNPYGAEYTLDIDYSKSVNMAGIITVDGKTVHFSFGIPNGLDAENIDDAYPAVTFDIEY